MRRSSLSMFALVLLAACGDDATSPDQGDGYSSAYDLVFQGAAGGQQLLFRAPADGSGVATLIGSGFAGVRPRVNPGHGSLLFDAIIPSSQTWGPMVHMLDQVSPYPLLDTEYEAHDAVVSPDGATVAFTYMKDDGLGDIYLADWDARGLVSNLRNVTPPAPPAVTYDGEPAWSPDSESIAFASNRSGLTKIWVMAADGANPRELTGRDGTERSPAWSPDGAWIAYEFDADDAPGTRIAVIRPDGTDVRVLALPGSSRDPAWSPAGDALAITSSVGGVTDIVVVSLAGDELARIDRPGTDANPAWLAKD